VLKSISNFLFKVFFYIYNIHYYCGLDSCVDVLIVKSFYFVICMCFVVFNILTKCFRANIKCDKPLPPRAAFACIYIYIYVYS
jgi:hypothetical protein